MKKLFITAIFLSFAGIAFYIFQPQITNDELGEITIIVVDQIGDIVSNKTIGFEEEDTLFSLLDDNYELGCASSQYTLTDNCESVLFGSRVLLKIDTVETDWLNSYIAIYIEDEYSISGIDLIPLEDGTTYRFEYTEVGEVEE